MARRRVGETLLAAALLLFVAGRCLVPMDETDLFFNLRLGEVVLHDHTVPTHNLLSFTHPEVRDVNLAWVFQVVLALAHRAGGIAGTVLLKTGFVLATFAILWRAALRRGAHPVAAALVLALVAWSAEPRFVERPHLVTFVGLACLLLALERAEQGKPGALWALLPAGLVWANSNSCFFLAPCVLVLYAAGAGLDRRRRDARRALLLAGLLAPMVFATPSGTAALGYIANHWLIPRVRPLQEYRVAEWPLDGPFFLLGAALLLGACWQRPWRQLLPCIALGLLGAVRIRFVAEFSLLAGPAAAAGLSALGRRLARGRSGESTLRVSLRLPAVPLAVAALLLLALGPRIQRWQAGMRWLDLGEEDGLVPHAAIDFASRRGLRERMYNDLEVGSYLTWDGWPRWRVFQDPRINGYPAAFHAILRRDDLGRAEWQALLDGYHVTSALITFPALNPRAALFDPERWALIYRDADALIFARRDVTAWRPMVNELEQPVELSYTREHGVSAQPMTQPPSSSGVSACSWKRRLGDLYLERDETRAAWNAYRDAMADQGCLTLAERDAARSAAGGLAVPLGYASKALELLAGLGGPQAKLNRALALLRLDRPQEALAELDALPASPGPLPDALLARGLALDELDRPADAAAALRAFLSAAPDHVGAASARERLKRLER